MVNSIFAPIDAIRTSAERFMTASVAIYNPTLSYDAYGAQTLVSGEATTVSAYFGAVSGKDLELIAPMMRDGVNATYFATVLMPHTTIIDDTSIIVFNNKNWNVFWHNSDTMNDVTAYRKCIVSRMRRYDEREL